MKSLFYHMKKTFTKELAHLPLMGLLKTESGVVYRQQFLVNDILFRKNYLTENGS